MATKKTSKKDTGKKKGNKKANTEIIPDWEKQYCDGNVVVSLYEKRGGGYSAKITFCGAFVLYAKIVEAEDRKGNEYAFISYPSWRTKDGEYVNFAYCFDKELNAEICNDITEFIFGDESED